MYGAKNADQYEGDLIIQKDDLIFIGKLMPGYSRSQNDLPQTHVPERKRKLQLCNVGSIKLQLRLPPLR